MREQKRCLVACGVLVSFLFYGTSCGLGGSSDDDDGIEGDLSSITVESISVDPSSDFSPTVSFSVADDGSLQIEIDPMDVDGDGEYDNIEFVSLTAESYDDGSGGSLSAYKALTVEFECQERTSGYNFLSTEFLDPEFVKMTSNGSGDSTITRQVNCMSNCADYHENEGRYLYALILAVLSAQGYTLQTIINAIIFIYLTC